MANREKLVKGGVQLLGSQGVVQFLSLARNFCIARLISQEDFGIAATFALTLSMIELIGDFSFDKLLIQDRDGENPTMQAVLQMLTLVRGILIGAAIFAAAGPIADIFDVPEAADAYRWLALAPVLKGFMHLDVRRVQRSLNFSAEIRLQIASQAIAFAVAVGLAWLWRDYMAVLWAVIAQAAVQGPGAHLLARRPYRMALRSAEVIKALRFGWPLMLNGFVLVLATQGDRALIGARLSMVDLAVYTALAMLVSALQLPVLKVTSSLTLPWLAAVQGDPLLARRSALTVSALALMAVLIFVPFVLFGSDAAALVFGPEYRGPATLAGWLAFGAALRVLRGGPVIISLAVGDTKNLMLSNIVRGIGIVLAALALSFGGSLTIVAAAMCAGEFAAYLTAAVRSRKLFESSSVPGLGPLALLTVPFSIALVFEATMPGQTIATRVILSAILTAIPAGLIVCLSPEFLHEALALSPFRRARRQARDI